MAPVLAQSACAGNSPDQQIIKLIVKTPRFEFQRPGVFNGGGLAQWGATHAQGSHQGHLTFFKEIDNLAAGVGLANWAAKTKVTGVHSS